MHSRTKTEPCLSLPMPWDIKAANRQWQLLNRWDQHTYLHSAHLDLRERRIRILAMADRRKVCKTVTFLLGFLKL